MAYLGFEGFLHHSKKLFNITGLTDFCNVIFHGHSAFRRFFSKPSSRAPMERSSNSDCAMYLSLGPVKNALCISSWVIVRFRLPSRITKVVLSLYAHIWGLFWLSGTLAITIHSSAAILNSAISI